MMLLVYACARLACAVVACVLPLFHAYINVMLFQRPLPAPRLVPKYRSSGYASAPLPLHRPFTQLLHPAHDLYRAAIMTPSYRLLCDPPNLCQLIVPQRSYLCQNLPLPLTLLFSQVQPNSSWNHSDRERLIPFRGQYGVLMERLVQGIRKQR